MPSAERFFHGRGSRVCKNVKWMQLRVRARKKKLLPRNMADLGVEQAIMSILRRIIEMLSMSVRSMETAIPAPILLDEGSPRQRWRYEHPSLLILQVLMLVRVVSGLRACVILLSQGHSVEVGVLYRTIDDFLADITFADEIIEQGMEKATVAQRDWYEGYFVDDNRPIEEMLADSVDPMKRNKQLVRRQKVQASEARVFGGEDPHYVKKLVKTLDDAWSGVVHGNYRSVMEMYGGPSRDETYFHCEGIPARFSQYRHFLGLLVHNALNQGFKVAHNLGMAELASQIIEFRREFETSPAYTSE
jgi:hypothetical protein